MTRRPAPPRGRDEVREAVLEAASDLFAERGTALVSVRDIAARAKVNHGLVHRHFGSKEALVTEVMDRLAAEIAEVPATERGKGLPLAVLVATGRSRYFKVLARALLDGADVAALQRRFPVAEALLDAAKEAKRGGLVDPDVDPRMAVATGLALGLGWLLFEPFLVAAVGLDRAPEELRRELARTILRMFRPA